MMSSTGVGTAVGRSPGARCCMAEPRCHVARGSRRRPGMHAYRRKQIGTGRGGDNCRGTACGQPRNLDAREIRPMIVRDRASYYGKEGRLAGTAGLVARLNQFQHLLAMAPTGCEG